MGSSSSKKKDICEKKATEIYTISGKDLYFLEGKQHYNTGAVIPPSLV